jgi:hypothetical protein
MKDTWERGRELIDRHGVTRSWHGRYLILDGWLLPGTQDSPEGREKSLVGRGQQDGTFRPAGRGVPARR